MEMNSAKRDSEGTVLTTEFFLLVGVMQNCVHRAETLSPRSANAVADDISTCLR